MFRKSSVESTVRSYSTWKNQAMDRCYSPCPPWSARPGSVDSPPRTPTPKCSSNRFDSPWHSRGVLIAVRCTVRQPWKRFLIGTPERHRQFSFEYDADSINKTQVPMAIKGLIPNLFSCAPHTPSSTTTNSIFNLEEAAKHEWDPDSKLGLFKDVEGVKVNVK